MLAAVVFQVLYPLLGRQWSGMASVFLAGRGPYIPAFWILARVRESPVWLARRSHLNISNQRDGLSILRIFRRDLVATTIQTSLLMGAFLMSYYSINFWYPTFLREARLPAIPYLVPSMSVLSWEPGCGVRFRDSLGTPGGRDHGSPDRSAGDPDLRRTACSLVLSLGALLMAACDGSL